MIGLQTKIYQRIQEFAVKRTVKRIFIYWKSEQQGARDYRVVRIVDRCTDLSVNSKIFFEKIYLLETLGKDVLKTTVVMIDWETYLYKILQRIKV